GDDGAGLDRLVAEVQAQVGLAGGAVRAVAGEAVVRQDRPDVAVVLRRVVGPQRRRGQGQAGQTERGEPGHRGVPHWVLPLWGWEGPAWAGTAHRPRPP